MKLISQTRLVFLGESERKTKWVSILLKERWMEGCRSLWLWVVENLGVSEISKVVIKWAGPHKWREGY